MNFQELIQANQQAFQGLTDITAIASKIQEVAKNSGFGILVDNTKEPSYIPKTRFDEVVTQKNELKTQVGELTGQLDGLKTSAGASEQLKKQIEDLQNAQKAKETDYTNKAKQSEIKIAAMQANVRKEALDDIVKFFDLGKVEVKADGTVAGIKEQLDSLQKDKAFLFGPASGGTGNPGDPGNNNKGSFTPEGIGAQLAALNKPQSQAPQVNYF